MCNNIGVFSTFYLLPSNWIPVLQLYIFFFNNDIHLLLGFWGMKFFLELHCDLIITTFFSLMWDARNLIMKRKNQKKIMFIWVTLLWFKNVTWRQQKLISYAYICMIWIICLDKTENMFILMRLNFKFMHYQIANLGISLILIINKWDCTVVWTNWKWIKSCKQCNNDSN